MRIIVKTKNLELTEWLEDLVNKRMAGFRRLVKNLQESSELLVEVERETKHHRKGDVFGAEAMINLPKANLVARAHGENLSRVITEVKKELESEIKKYKTKIIELPRRKYRKIKRKSAWWREPSLEITQIIVFTKNKTSLLLKSQISDILLAYSLK